MTTQETAAVHVRLTFTTERGELPTLAELRQLVTDQLAGVLDDGTGLALLDVEIASRWDGELVSEPPTHLVLAMDADDVVFRGTRDGLADWFTERQIGTVVLDADITEIVGPDGRKYEVHRL